MNFINMNLDSDFFKYFGMIAFAFFILFVISQVFSLNDRLLQGFKPTREGFSSSEPDRTTLNQDTVKHNLANAKASLRKRLQLPAEKDAIEDQLDEYLENVGYEELLLLNLASSTENISDDKILWIGNQLGAYKEIKDAINRVDIPSH